MFCNAYFICMLWSVPDIIRDCFLCWPYVDNTDLLIDEKQHFPGLFVYHVVYPGSFLWGQVTHHGFHLLPSQSLESLLYPPLLLLYVTMEHACNSTTKQFSGTDSRQSFSAKINYRYIYMYINTCYPQHMCYIVMDQMFIKCQQQALA